MDWTTQIRYSDAMAQRELARRINSHSLRIPVGDSPATAPGWLYEGHFYSCIPDAQYPWDLDVLKAIREIDPTAMPLVIRSVWRWSNYHELGRIEEPMVLVRHGIGRAVRAPHGDLPRFHCEMPSTPVSGLRIPGRSWLDCRPNDVWSEWWDKDKRDHGFDLPGAYLPFDWSFYYALLDADYARTRVLRESKQREDEQGNMIAKGAAAPLIADRKQRDAQATASSRSEQRAAFQEIESYHKAEPSDVEWKEANLGG